MDEPEEVVEVGDVVEGFSGSRLATAFFNPSSDLAMRVHRYDDLAKSCATARPIPREAPVIRTCRGWGDMSVIYKLMRSEIRGCGCGCGCGIALAI